ncbi:MAG: PTS sugar transporter subunit IIA [Nitrospinales bacterium]
MKISEILKKDFVIAELPGKDKPGILRELSGFLKNKGVVKDQETLYQALMDRENLGSTGIGENVAVPHAKSAEIDRVIILFARSTAGIDFAALDEKPVHFVCLLIAPSNSTGLHLKALARMSRLLKNEKLRQDILNANGVDEIYSILLEEDSRFI